MKKLQVEEENKQDISIKIKKTNSQDDMNEMNEINPLKFKTLKIINSLFFVLRFLHRILITLTYFQPMNWKG
jgi:hypothetical protein